MPCWIYTTGNLPFFLGKYNSPLNLTGFELYLLLKISLNEVAFIGDDINDMSIINIVGFSACPSDASQPVKEKVSLILNTKGGYGCVREFSDLYLSQN